jgi:hypothetical protein
MARTALTAVPYYSICGVDYSETSKETKINNSQDRIYKRITGY